MTAARVPYASVGRYELLLPIGRGGVGQVFLGRYEVAPGVQRHVAVKLVHPTLHDADSGDDAMLLREAKLASRIRHPNVVEVVETGVHDGNVFLALDYVEGTNLHRMLVWAHRQQVALPIPVVGRIVADALEGLQAAHDLCDDHGRPLGLVHRDFTPQNILIGVDGVTKLTDFGVAKSHQQTAATSTGVVKGKVAYMAPEQAMGRTLDARVDVWSAGVVLWEALTGKRMFRQSTDAATLLAIVTPSVPPLASSRRSGVSDELDAAIAAAVTHDPEARLASAAELRRRLATALEDEGLADHVEVASWVARVAGEELSDRREVLAAAPASVSGMRSAVHTTEGTAVTRAALEASDQTEVMPSADSLSEHTATTTTSARDVMPAASRRWLWSVPMLGVAAAVGVMFAAGGDRAAMVREARSPAASSALRAATESAVDNDVLRIAADAPLAHVTVGTRAVVLATPAREVELTLRPDEVGKPLSLVVKTVNGRRISRSLHADEREVTLEGHLESRRAGLPTPQRPARPSPRASSPKSKSAVDSDGLAHTPY